VLCRGRAVHADDGWQSLFDGRSLGQWKPTEFGGEGVVTVDDTASFSRWAATSPA
jgi:hypothetical protein